MAELPRQSDGERWIRCELPDCTGCMTRTATCGTTLRDATQRTDSPARARESAGGLSGPPAGDGPPASYYVEIAGDDGRLVAGDIIDLIKGHYAVEAAIAAPLEVKVTIRDGWGATRAYAHTWHPMKRLTLTTGATRADMDAVRAEVELGPVRP